MGLISGEGGDVKRKDEGFGIDNNLIKNMSYSITNL